MTAPSPYLKLFLTSLTISLAWYYYHSRDFVIMLDRLLVGAAAAYAVVAFVRWSRQRSGPVVESRPPLEPAAFAPLRTWSWWNTVGFFGLVFTASFLATVRYQFSRPEFLREVAIQGSAWLVIAVSAWKLTRRQPHLIFHLPLAFGSLLLAYEIHLTTRLPPLNQSVVLEPVMGLPYVCYNGGSGRLINDHFGLPQRRYLTAVVPGDQTFRSPGTSALAARDAEAIGTPALSPVHGTVVSVVSHLPDLDPGRSDPSHPAGNHLCIQFGPARYLYLANLSQYSVIPRVGDVVEPGDPVARLGKNGSFSESALIVLVVTDPNVILPDTVSLPFYFSGMVNPDGRGEDQPVFPRRNTILTPRLLPLAPFWSNPAAP